MKRISCIAVLLLVGCSAPAAEDVVPDDGRVTIDVEEMNVSFLFREPLVLKASQNEALLAGTSTRMQVQTRAYGEPGKPAQPDGLGMWELPSAVAKMVRDERSCMPFKDKGVYLPVDASLPVQCDMVLDTTGRVVVWMVGIGRPFEALPFLQSQLLVLEENRYHVFAYIEPFAESDATVQWLHDSFRERHPNMSALIWPNKSFKMLEGEVKQALSQQVEQPSEEVREVMDRLRDLAFSVGPSRALTDR